MAAMGTGVPGQAPPGAGQRRGSFPGGRYPSRSMMPSDRSTAAPPPASAGGAGEGKITARLSTRVVAAKRAGRWTQGGPLDRDRAENGGTQNKRALIGGFATLVLVLASCGAGSHAPSATTTPPTRSPSPAATIEASPTSTPAAPGTLASCAGDRPSAVSNKR